MERLGWSPTFARQIDAEALTATPPVRVVAVHRSGLQVAGDGIEETVPPGRDATVGDWLLYDRARPRSSRVLDRKSLITRRAPERYLRSGAPRVASRCAMRTATGLGEADPKGHDSRPRSMAL